jgi:hypothetical protein
MKKKSSIFTLSILLALLASPVLVSAQEAVPSVEIKQERVEKTTELRENAKLKREVIKQNIEARKLSIKKDVCNNRKDRLKALQPKINTRAIRIKSNIDRKYERIIDFYESGRLTTPDYETLIDAIEIAKVSAETSIETLQSYQFEVDCESQKVANQLASYREAAAETKTSLKDYRAKLVALISSLNASAASQTGETNE